MSLAGSALHAPAVAEQREKTVPHAVVIGAGLGGLGTGIHLAQRGWDGTILERTKIPGGRMNRIKAEGLQFDTGIGRSTWPCPPSPIPPSLRAAIRRFTCWYTPYRTEGVDWSTEGPRYRERILDRLEQRGLTGLRESI
jgi:cation diffusion facilitator CzcD-associated flavoprotein CzcO